jgi:hypothetical protein
MGLEYPKIPAEDVLFREQFYSNQYVADNGGTLVGAPTVDNGVTLNGTTQYASYPISGLGDKAGVTMEISFIPGFAYDEDSNRAIIDATSGSEYRVVKFNNAVSNVLGIRLGGTGINIPSASYGAYWKVGQLNHLVIAGTSGATDAYLNGVKILDADASAWNPKNPTTLHVGSSNSLSSLFAGGIREISIYGRKFTAGEVADRFTQQTFKEVKPENSELWLPLRSRYNDGANMITPNLGGIPSSNFKVGDGSTSTTYPTFLEKNGCSFDGGDYFSSVSTSAMDWDGASSFTVGGLLRMPKDAGFQSIFNKHTDTDPHGAGVGWSLHKHSTAGIRCYIRLNDGYRPIISAANTAIQDDQWHFAAVVIDIDTGYGTIWVDDTPGTPVDISGGGDISNAQPFQIGAAVGPTGFYTGDMKFPFFIREALTPTQLKWLKDYSFRNLNI